MSQCVLQREWAPGSRESPGAGLPPSPEPRRAPAPAHPRPRCQSPLALTGSRQSGPGAGLMQSARYLGRRLHYQPGPRPARSEPASLRPAGRPALSALLRPRPSATRRSPAPARAPQPGEARRGEARRVRSRQGRAHGSRDPVAAERVSAPCARNRARCAGEAQVGMRRGRVPASLKCRGNKCPGRLLGLSDVAQTRAEGRGQPAAPGRVTALGNLCLDVSKLRRLGTRESG